ncbi:hypothetical protein ACOSP7_006027 [Xanthoceras sorbifolium]
MASYFKSVDKPKNCVTFREPKMAQIQIKQVAVLEATRYQRFTGNHGDAIGAANEKLGGDERSNELQVTIRVYEVTIRVHELHSAVNLSTGSVA